MTTAAIPYIEDLIRRTVSTIDQLVADLGELPSQPNDDYMRLYETQIAYEEHLARLRKILSDRRKDDLAETGS